MIEQQEYRISIDQLIDDIDERVRNLDEHIVRVKRMIASQRITHHEDRALFYAMNLMLKERRELIELKERSLLDDSH